MRYTILAGVVASFLVVGATEVTALTIPERLLVDLQEEFDWADFQAAGVTGNLARETGNFRYLQEINPIVEGSRGGIGYSQWTGSRRVAFEAWVGDEDHLSYDANFGFLVEELRGEYAKVVEQVRETTSAEDAAEVFMRSFLKPHRNYTHLDERIAYANAYLSGDFSGAGCQKYHEVEVSGRMMIVEMCPDQVTDTYLVEWSSTYALVDMAEIIEDLDAELVEIVIAEMLAHNEPLKSSDLENFRITPERVWNASFDPSEDPEVLVYELLGQAM